MLASQGLPEPVASPAIKERPGFTLPRMCAQTSVDTSCDALSSKESPLPWGWSSLTRCMADAGVPATHGMRCAVVQGVSAFLGAGHRCLASLAGAGTPTDGRIWRAGERRLRAD